MGDPARRDQLVKLGSADTDFPRCFRYRHVGTPQCPAIPDVRCWLADVRYHRPGSRRIKMTIP